MNEEMAYIERQAQVVRNIIPTKFYEALKLLAAKNTTSCSFYKSLGLSHTKCGSPIFYTCATQNKAGTKSPVLVLSLKIGSILHRRYTGA